jgi:hypothetical protein
MKIIVTSIASTLLLLSSSAFAKDLVIMNNTDALATAKTKTSMCSSVGGDAGMLKPHKAITVSQWIQDFYCAGQCDADIYISDNCSGQSVATAHIKQGSGIVSINNHNQGSYRVVGSGYNISLEGGDSKNSFFNFLSKIL